MVPRNVGMADVFLSRLGVDTFQFDRSRGHRSLRPFRSSTQYGSVVLLVNDRTLDRVRPLRSPRILAGEFERIVRRQDGQPTHRPFPDYLHELHRRLPRLHCGWRGKQRDVPMNWRQPSTVWQWLALLSPAAVMVVCGTALPGWLNALLGHGYDTFGTQTGVGIEGLLAGTAMSFILGFWWARDGEESFIGRCVSALGYGMVIEFINLFVAFAGCTGVAVLGRAISR